MANVIEGAPTRHLQRLYEADAKHIVATCAVEFVTNKSAHWEVSRFDLDSLRKIAGQHAADAFDRDWLRNNKPKGANLKNHEAFLELMFAALAGKAQKLAADLDRVRNGTADTALAEQFAQAVACTGDIAGKWIELTKEAFVRKDPYYPEPQPTTTLEQIKTRAQETVDGALERYVDSVAWQRASSAPTDKATTPPPPAQQRVEVAKAILAKPDPVRDGLQKAAEEMRKNTPGISNLQISKALEGKTVAKGLRRETIRKKI